MYRGHVLDVFVSPSAAERQAAALQCLRRVPKGRASLILAPTWRAGRALLRAWATQASGVLDCEVLTLAQLALQLARPVLAAQGRAPLSPRAAEALCAGLLANEPLSNLGPLAAIASQPSLPSALARTLSDLKTHGVGPSELATTAPHVQHLLNAYQTALQTDGLADSQDVLALALQQLSRRPVRYHTIAALDVPLHAGSETHLVQTLAEQVSQLHLSLFPGDVTTCNQLKAAGVALPSPPLPREAHNAGLARVQHQLFSATHAQPPTLASDGTVHVLSAPDESRECAEVARTLLWAAEQGLPFDRMAVLPRSLSAYRSHLSEALARAQIPYYTPRATRRPDPQGRALLALLQCRVENLCAQRFAEYLSLQVASPTGTTPDEPAYVPPSEALGRRLAGQNPLPAAPEPAPDLRWPQRFEQLLTQATVVAGQERFEQRLAGLHEELLQQQAAAERAGLADPGLTTALHDLKALRAFASPLLAQLAALPSSCALSEWLAHLKQLALLALGDPTSALASLAELEPLASTRQAPIELQPLIRQLTPLLAQLTTSDSSDEAGKVFVADASAARGRSFDLVCIPGLVEKVFPQKVAEDPLLLDRVRIRLNEALPTRAIRVAQERTLLHLAVGAAQARLVLTYPRMDLQGGRPRVPSFYVLEALRAAEGTLPSYEALMRRAEAHAPSRAGWPAPLLPRDAIDAAEHDLASLHTPLASAEGSTECLGEARYLLLTNPHLARALRGRARRWGVKALTPDDGLLDPPPAAHSRLQARRPAQQAYTSSTLAMYAQCPYRFFLRAVLELGSKEPPTRTPTMHPLQRAELLRDCQAEILQALKAESLWPLQQEQLPAAFTLATRAVQRHGQRSRERFVPSVQRVFDDGVQRALADLHAWLRRLAKAQPASPIQHVALDLGLPTQAGQDPASQTEPVQLPQGLLFRGHIDLVTRQGGVLTAILLRSGLAEAPPGLQLAGGSHLAPALEAVALKTLYPTAKAVRGHLYYNTARGGFEHRSVDLTPALEQAVGHFARTLDQALDQGFFPALPTPTACDHCEYQRVCGPHERLRTRHKRSAKLQPLQALRRTP